MPKNSSASPERGGGGPSSGEAGQEAHRQVAPRPISEIHDGIVGRRACARYLRLTGFCQRVVPR